MIKVKDLHFTYPDSEFSLNIPSLTIQENEKVAIIGPSGFGKTTLLNLFSGILSPQKGEIGVGDTAIARLSDQEKRKFRINNIGFIFQDFKLIDYLKVKDNILLPFRINKLLKRTASTDKSVDQLAELLGIEDKLNKYPAKLSQGEQQRVAIGRALITKPKIILADEPTGNLDPENKQKIKKILFDLTKDYNATLITVTHDHDLLSGFDRTIDFQNIQSLKHEG